MRDAFQETVATGSGISAGSVSIGFADELPNTLGTTASCDPEQIRDLCSDLPLRWPCRPCRLPRVAGMEDADLAGMAMDISSETFAVIWNDPEEEVWDRL